MTERFPDGTRTALARLPHACYNDHQTGDRADDYCIYEHLECAPKPLARRMVDIGGGVDDRGAAPTGFIAVNASGNADL